MQYSKFIKNKIKEIFQRLVMNHGLSKHAFAMDPLKKLLISQWHYHIEVSIFMFSKNCICHQSLSISPSSSYVTFDALKWSINFIIINGTKSLLFIWCATVASQFKKNITACGGLIQGPESGILTSPGFYGKENSTYEPDTQCVWSLKAPEGQIVKVRL